MSIIENTIGKTLADPFSGSGTTINAAEQTGRRCYASLAMAEALTGQGYYTESIELLREQERYFVGKAVKQETFVDDKGNLKSRKLSEEEMIVRFNDYANLLTQLGNTYGKQGSLKSADSVFVFAAGWI